MTAFMTVPRADAAPHSPDAIALLRIELCEALADEATQLADTNRTIDELTGQQDSDSILEREIAERRHALAGHFIAAIEAALRRIEAGTYGRCEDCDRLIAIERLEVIPFARRCVHCSASAPRLIG